jgi:hypothetical protein
MDMDSITGMDILIRPKPVDLIFLVHKLMYKFFRLKFERSATTVLVTPLERWPGCAYSGIPACGMSAGFEAGATH